MRLRAVGAVVLAGAALAALAGCQTKVGQAAVVGGHAISETDVGKYVTKSGPSQAVKDAAAQQGQTLPPAKVEAVSTLIQQELFSEALDRAGSVPTEAQLTQLHDETVQRLFQSSVAGDQFDAALVKQAKQYGFSEAFAPLVLRAAELEDAYINKTKAQSVNDVAASIAKLHIPITVSGRYGVWDPKALQLSSDVTDGLPSFVTFGAGAAADANQ